MRKTTNPGRWAAGIGSDHEPLAEQLTAEITASIPVPQGTLSAGRIGQRPLRPHQARAIEILRQSLRAGRPQ